MDCPKTHNAHQKLRCCNCGGEHTANNLTTCKYFQENIVKKPEANKNNVKLYNNQIVSKNTNFRGNLRRDGVSFASVAKGNVGCAPGHFTTELEM